MIVAELYNLRSGAHLSRAEKRAHPDAEYFTAERRVTDEEAAAGIKRVSFAFRMIATVKNGELVDCVKSGEEHSLVAGIHDGKTVLFEYSQIGMEDKILGVCVRVIFHYVK